MARSSKAQFIKVPNRLAAKVTVIDESPEEKFARAEAALAEMHDDYTIWVDQDLRSLKRSLAAARSDPAQCRQHLEALYRTIHDMKGQGQTFGYPLVTEIGESLCRFLDKVDGVGDIEFAVIESHVGALSAVIVNRVEGDGGDIGRQVTLGLRAAVDKLLTGAGGQGG